jgi:hypothetical protein
MQSYGHVSGLSERENLTDSVREPQSALQEFWPDIRRKFFKKK